LLAMCKIQRYIQILSASRNYVKLLGLSPSLRTLRVIASASLGSSFQYISIVSIFRSIAKLLSCYHLYSFFQELLRITGYIKCKCKAVSVNTILLIFGFSTADVALLYRIQTRIRQEFTVRNSYNESQRDALFLKFI
jgi:hypothetical protein